MKLQVYDEAAFRAHASLAQVLGIKP